MIFASPWLVSEIFLILNHSRASQGDAEVRKLIFLKKKNFLHSDSDQMVCNTFLARICFYPLSFSARAMKLCQNKDKSARYLERGPNMRLHNDLQPKNSSKDKTGFQELFCKAGGARKKLSYGRLELVSPDLGTALPTDQARVVSWLVIGVWSVWLSLYSVRLQIEQLATCK